MKSQEQYTCPELDRLTREYPVDEVLGRLKDQWQSGLLHDSTSHWLFFRGGMPSGVQDTYGQFLYDAANTGTWVGFKTEWQPRFLQEFKAKKEARTLDHDLATAEAMDQGLLDLVEHDGAVYAVPLERFMPYVKEKVQQHLQALSRPRGL